MPLTRFIPLCLLAFCAACAPAALPQGELAELRNRAAECQLREEWPCAEAALTAAVQGDPASPGAEALLLADLRLLLHRPADARDLLAASLKRLPADDPDRDELVLRLALLHLEEFDDPSGAQRWAGQLPPRSPLQILYLATLDLHEGRAQECVPRLNLILGRPLKEDLTGRLYFTAARAYQALGLADETSLSLFHAINFARSPALVQAIKAFWKTHGEH